MLNAIETGTKNHNTSTGWIGTNAGKSAKSKCNCPSGTTSGTCVSDAAALWYYNSSTLGDDVYGFRVLPSGGRECNGSYFYNRGIDAIFWSSSAASSTTAWYRNFRYNYATVSRNISYNSSRSYGISVRCIRD
jgi:uncharacterized protein (TIGR02145 family)